MRSKYNLHDYNFDLNTYLALECGICLHYHYLTTSQTLNLFVFACVFHVKAREIDAVGCVLFHNQICKRTANASFVHHELGSSTINLDQCLFVSFMFRNNLCKQNHHQPVITTIPIIEL